MGGTAQWRELGLTFCFRRQQRSHACGIRFAIFSTSLMRAGEEIGEPLGEVCGRCPIRRSMGPLDILAPLPLPRPSTSSVGVRSVGQMRSSSSCRFFPSLALPILFHVSVRGMFGALAAQIRRIVTIQWRKASMEAALPIRPSSEGPVQRISRNKSTQKALSHFLVTYADWNFERNRLTLA